MRYFQPAVGLQYYNNAFLKKNWNAKFRYFMTFILNGLELSFHVTLLTSVLKEDNSNPLKLCFKCFKLFGPNRNLI